MNMTDSRIEENYRKEGYRMKDPYQKAFEQTWKGINQIYEMILWIAKRTLSMHEFEEFSKEFSGSKKDGEQE